MRNPGKAYGKGEGGTPRLLVGVILLALTMLALLGVAPTLVAGSGDKGGVRPVWWSIESVSCRSENNTTIITITLKLPTPGYKINASHIVKGPVLIANLTLVPPNFPVAQVITYEAVSFRVNMTPLKVIVNVNGTKGFEGPCKPETAFKQNMAESSPTTTRQHQAATASTTGQASNAEPNNTAQAPAHKKTYITGVSIIALLLGAGIIAAARRT
ncbi:MAG: hypothetical protein LRS48_04385 [Desulfurococcales archaeon]|nr:hypothetical protein [Desulfurococcales archaeon]